MIQHGERLGGSADWLLLTRRLVSQCRAFPEYNNQTLEETPMAKEKWLMLLLVAVVMAIAVPITIFALSTQTLVKVDAEDSAGNKFKVDVKGLGIDSFVGCVAMTGNLEFETAAGVKTKIEPDLWSDVDGSSIVIHDEGSCLGVDVRINLLGNPITVTTGATGSALPENIFTLGVGPKMQVEVKTD